MEFREYGYYAHREDGRDISKLSQEELYDLIYLDAITGYYNWTYLWKFLDYRHRDPEETYCFVHFDIKDFKLVNDLYSHLEGNELLKLVCRTMENNKDWILHACRCDNDNFAMMVKPMDDEEIVERLEKFFDSISVLPADESYKVFYRCGVVSARDAFAEEDTVADLAKFAQQMGTKPNCTEINFYTKEMYENLLRGKRYISYLENAIKNDEFVVYLQPKFNTETEKIVGAEALVRWRYKHKTFLSPSEFIPLFESLDVIGKVDQIVLKKVCAFLASLKEKNIPVFPISVNLSRRRIENRHLKEQLCKTVDKYGIDHKLIEFELTESSAYQDLESMYSLLDSLRDSGFSISIDDFGTGYSSLSLLRSIPMDTLKIDKCFVDSILTAEENGRELILLQDIITMAKHMGFNCIAEGAEEKSQVDYLKKLGCTKVQGFYYSRPVPMEEYERMVIEQEIAAKKTAD